MKLLYEHYCDTKDFIYIFNLNTRSSKIRIQAWTIIFSPKQIMPNTFKFTNDLHFKFNLTRPQDIARKPFIVSVKNIPLSVFYAHQKFKSTQHRERSIVFGGTF